MPASINIQMVANQIVRHALVGQGREDQALHIHFDMRMAYYHENNRGEFKASRGLHLLYFVPPGMSYISVFSAIVPSPFTKAQEVPSWRHDCTHDSCWSEGPTISECYFTMATEINDKLAEAGLASVAPIRMSEHNAFALFRDRLWDWVPAKVTKDPTDDRNYRKLITLG